jgi:hypothetical protein
VLEPLHERRLAREPLEHPFREERLDEDHLESDLAAERPLERAIDGAVTALTEELDELVAFGDDLSGRKRWGLARLDHPDRERTTSAPTSAEGCFCAFCATKRLS